jgi:F-type H+-transporting ATPase subunit b
VELSWSTFILEIINFLVLVWILKRFLYRPVLDVVARRRAAVQKTLDDARQTQADAEQMQTQYRNRLSDWEKEKEAAHEELRSEISAERERLNAELQAGLVKERERAKAVDERRQKDLARRLEETALAQGAQFATRLLGRAAGPELEGRLVEIAIADLGQLEEEDCQALRNAWQSGKETIDVASAYPLGDARLGSLRAALAKLLGAPEPAVQTQTRTDDNLIAGLRISVGPWVLRANLRDELTAFADLAHDAD